MPSQHTYCGRVWNLIQDCDVQSYKYVCILQSNVEKCTEGSVIKVMALNYFKTYKKTYIPNEGDISYVNVSDVLGVLRTPVLGTQGERVR